MPRVQRDPADQQHRRYHELYHGRVRPADAFLWLRHDRGSQDHCQACKWRRHLHNSRRPGQTSRPWRHHDQRRWKACRHRRYHGRRELHDHRRRQNSPLRGSELQRDQYPTFFQENRSPDRRLTEVWQGSWPEHNDPRCQPRLRAHGRVRRRRGRRRLRRCLWWSKRAGRSSLWTGEDQCASWNFICTGRNDQIFWSSRSQVRRWKECRHCPDMETGYSAHMRSSWGSRKILRIWQDSDDSPAGRCNCRQASVRPESTRSRPRRSGRLRLQPGILLFLRVTEGIRQTSPWRWRCSAQSYWNRKPARWGFLCHENDLPERNSDISCHQL